jgi:hypothetical protein
MKVNAALMLHLPRLSKPKKTSQKVVEELPDEPKQIAGDLVGHCFWGGITFIVILLIAGGIELFARRGS